MKKWMWILFIILTFLVIYFNLSINYDHIAELERINKLERQEKLKEYKKKQMRKTTLKCPIIGLETPRDCYYNSNFRCKWNIIANRCNKI